MADNEDDRPHIVITLKDIQQIPKDPRKEHIMEITSEAKDLAVSRMDSSASLGGFMRYHYAALVSTPDLSGWMFKENPDLKPDDILEEFEDPGHKERYEKEAKLAEEMKQQIEETENNGEMRIALARVRDKNDSGNWTYRVLAAFPNGEKASDDVLDNSISRKPDTDYVYYQPQEACVQHACDLMYRKNKQSGAERAITVARNPYVPFMDAYNAVRKHSDSEGKSEFIIDRSLTGEVITQTPEKYVIAGIQNVFKGEWHRTRVSDFWNRDANQG